MTLNNTDLLIIGRGSESYQVQFSDSGISDKEYVSDYSVAKIGDTMSGKLTISSGGLDVHDPAEFYDHVRIDDTNNSATEYVLNVRSYSSDPQYQIGSHSRFGVLGNGAVTLGSDHNTPFMATRDHHAVSHKFLREHVESKLDFSQYPELT